MDDVCARCGSGIGRDPLGNLDNALGVEFLGGYGQFVDPPMAQDPSKYQIVVCHECAHEVCEKAPWLRKILEPAYSGSHTQEYWRDHPEHYGWDHPVLVRLRKEDRLGLDANVWQVVGTTASQSLLHDVLHGRFAVVPEGMEVGDVLVEPDLSTAVAKYPSRHVLRRECTNLADFQGALMSRFAGTVDDNKTAK